MDKNTCPICQNKMVEKDTANYKDKIILRACSVCDVYSVEYLNLDMLEYHTMENNSKDYYKFLESSF